MKVSQNLIPNIPSKVSQRKLKELFWLQIGSHCSIIDTADLPQAIHIFFYLKGAIQLPQWLPVADVLIMEQWVPFAENGKMTLLYISVNYNGSPSKGPLVFCVLFNPSPCILIINERYAFSMSTKNAYHCDLC